MVSKAAAWSSEPEDRLITEALRDPQKRELLYRAVHSAAGAVDEVKLDALARSFATGALARDTAVVDHMLIVVETLSRLEAPDLRLLDVLAQRGPQALPGGGDGERQEPTPHALSQGDILKADPGLAPAFDALIGRLQGMGLAYNEGTGRTGYMPFWRLTNFGVACVSHLLQRGGDSAGDSGDPTVYATGNPDAAPESAGNNE
jgi:hypothetical protein